MRFCAVSLRVALPLLALVSVAGCKSSPEYAALPKAKAKDYTRELPPGMKGLRKISPAEYPDFSKGYSDREGVLAALDASAAYLARPSAKGYFPYLDISHDRAEASIRAFRDDLTAATSGQELDRRIRERYEVYESIGWNGDGEMLFTAYHEPIYQGSLKPTDKFRYPIYKRPPELETDETGEKSYIKGADGSMRPAPSRAELDSYLRGRGLELVYLADPFEAYVVQVQGSARFQLIDGKELRVGYAGDNGHEYHPIWEPLVKSGEIKKEEVSLRRLKEYFAANPAKLNTAINNNPRFVFFTERTGPAVGCLNVPVTAWHSIATDRNRKDDIFPRAGVAYAMTKIPRTVTGGEAEFASFVCDQDRGGAIRSAGRADVFLGTGDTAEALAGRTKAEGRLYYVFLKPELTAPVTAMLQQEKAAKNAAKPAAAKKPAKSK